MNEQIRHQYGPWALIAGGSEGIGLCFARRLADAGINLVLLARREWPLREAAEELASAYPVEIRTHAIDLTGADIAAQLESITRNIEVGLLIYNAGAMHGAALFHDEPLAASLQLIALNCSGPAPFAHQLGGPMRERGRGGIILLSSMSGLTGGAYVATYAATKAFDIAFAEGLWGELYPDGVHVLGLIAGSTDTPAMAATGIDFGDGGAMDPDDVAREGLENLGQGPVHIAGEGNREIAPLLRGENRRQSVALMSAGAAGMFGLEAPDLPV